MKTSFRAGTTSAVDPVRPVRLRRSPLLTLGLSAMLWLASSYCSFGELWSWRLPVSSNAFQSTAEARIALGFRATSVASVTNLLASVWLRDYAPAELQLFVPYEQVHSNLMELQARGFRPAHLTVYGQEPTESYVIGYVEDGAEATVLTRLTQAELLDLSDAQPDQRVAWVTCDGAGEVARYAAVLLNDGQAGKLESGLDKTALEEKISSYGAAGYRPVCVFGNPDTSGMTYTANWVQESEPVRWTNAVDLSQAELTGFLASLGTLELRAEVITPYLAEDRQTRLFSVVCVPDRPPVWRVTGNPPVGLQEFDEVMTNAMQMMNCTRASLAVTKDGRLMLSRGYTHHPESIPATQPTNRFRVASISKTLTAVAVMGLAEAGRLQLDDPLGKFLDLSDVVDARWTNITVRHLLHHRGGWDASLTFDPMYADQRISAALGVPLPITQDHIITYMKQQYLQHEPGSQYAYSNFGFVLLGRVIEEVTGQNYATFVRENVLAPLGIHAAQLGRTARADQLPGEVEYEEGFGLVPSVLSPDRPLVAYPYGKWNLNYDAPCGAWVFSAEDLVRFCATFTDKSNCALLSPETIEVMWSPAPQEQLPATGWYQVYGCGWQMRGIDQGPPVYAYHGGGYDGTSGAMVRQEDGYCWAVLLNTANYNGTGLDTAIASGQRMFNAIAAVTQWPTNDLFDSDADGLPDSYERAQFGSLQASDGSGDTDGDGVPDTAEWVAMSSPVLAAETPRLNVRAKPEGGFELEMQTRGGRAYSLHRVPTLETNWDASTIITEFNGDGFNRVFELNTLEPAAFYRLRISPRATSLTPNLIPPP